MKTNGKIKKAAVAAVIVGMVCAGGTVAYLTDNENCLLYTSDAADEL